MEINLCAAGFGGQGVMTLGKLLAQAACASEGRYVTFFPSYGAEQRGGTANCYVVLSDEFIGAPIADAPDDLIVMNEASLDKFLPRLRSGGWLFVNSSIVKKIPARRDICTIYVPATELALQLGSAKVLNVIMLGAYVGATEAVPRELVWQEIARKLATRPRLLPLNHEAFEKGLELGKTQSAAKNNAALQ